MVIWPGPYSAPNDLFSTMVLFVGDVYLTFVFMSLITMVDNLCGIDLPKLCSLDFLRTSRTIDNVPKSYTKDEPYHAHPASTGNVTQRSTPNELHLVLSANAHSKNAYRPPSLRLIRITFMDLLRLCVKTCVRLYISLKIAEMS